MTQTSSYMVNSHKKKHIKWFAIGVEQAGFKLKEVYKLKAVLATQASQCAPTGQEENHPKL